MNKFWSYTEQRQDEPSELWIDGEIASESWWGDEVTPKMFRAELGQHPGDLTVWINSPGGDVFAASEIYSALKEHKGQVTIKVAALAASAATVIMMAGDQVYIAPTAYMMIHNPWTVAIGDSDEMRYTAKVLDEISEGIITAYQFKTGMDRDKLEKLMKASTWMNAVSALEYGFVDGILYAEQHQDDDGNGEDDEDEKAAKPSASRKSALIGAALTRGVTEGVVYASARAADSLLQKIRTSAQATIDNLTTSEPNPETTANKDARRRLELRMRLMANATTPT